MANGKGISSVTMTDSGELYISIPTVRVSKPTAEKKPAAITATLDSDGRVNGLTIDSEGTYYTAVPGITIAAPDSDVQGGINTVNLSTNPIGSNWDVDSSDLAVTGGSGVGARVNVTVNGSGQVNGLSVAYHGKDYVQGDILTIVSTANGENATFAVVTVGTQTATAPTATGTITNGRLTGVTLFDSQGDFYDTAPTVTVAQSAGGPGNFTASLGVELDSATDKIDHLYIIDSGDFYIEAPTITINEPISTKRFIIGETIEQDELPDGCILTGEVSAYSDSDNVISLIHVGSKVGDHFHEPTTGYYITGKTSGAKGKITKATEKEDAQTQNKTFSTEIESFLDFTESNPFGEPAQSGDHEH